MVYSGGAYCKGGLDDIRLQVSGYRKTPDACCLKSFLTSGFLFPQDCRKGTVAIRGGRVLRPSG
jgi:hypothetical protein